MPKLFCNACQTVYEDETLRFCLNDGTRLTPLGDNAEATVRMPLPPQTNPLRFDLQNSAPTVPSVNPPARRAPGLLIGLTIAGFLLILTVAGIAAAYFAFGDKSEIAATTPTPTASPSRTASPLQTATPRADNKPDKTDAATKDLEEKLKKLEKQLEAQKQANRIAPNPNQTPDQTPNQNGFVTARVNSPNDGFLALRSAPNTETGRQLLKIPHGSTVTLNNCEKTTIKISGRSGRWCHVEFGNSNGWVFSAWLDY